MSDRKITLRAYSQDRENYRRQSRSMNTKISTNYNMTSENYYSNRNCPEMLSIFALTNKTLDHRVKEIYRSTANDKYNFHMINYPIESPSTSPIPNLESENDKQPKLPILTPRSAAAGKKVPTLTKRSIPLKADNKNPMPTIQTSVKPVSSSLQKSTQLKTSTISKDKKKKILSPVDLHHPV